MPFSILAQPLSTMAANSNAGGEPQEEDAAELHFPKGGENIPLTDFQALFICTDRCQILIKQTSNGSVR